MSLINREALLSFEKMYADLFATCGEHHTAENETSNANRCECVACQNRSK